METTFLGGYIAVEGCDGAYFYRKRDGRFEKFIRSGVSWDWEHLESSELLGVGTVWQKDDDVWGKQVTRKLMFGSYMKFQDSFVAKGLGRPWAP